MNNFICVNYQAKTIEDSLHILHQRWRWFLKPFLFLELKSISCLLTFLFWEGNTGSLMSACPYKFMWLCVYVLLITILKQGSDFLVTSSELIPFMYHTIFIFRSLSSIWSTCRCYVWQVMDVWVLRVLFWGYDAIIWSRRFEAPHLQGSIRLRLVDTWRWGLPTDAASHPRRTESRLHRCKIYTTMHILFFRFGSTLAACWTRGVRTWRIMAADTSGLLELCMWNLHAVFCKDE